VARAAAARLLEDPALAARLGAAARATAARWSWQTRADRLAGFLAEVTARGPRATGAAAGAGGKKAVNSLARNYYKSST
jgi:hypothetical protein